MSSNDSRETDFVISIPIYEGVDLLDVAAPSELFSWLKENWKEKQTTLWLVAEDHAEVVTRDGSRLLPHRTFGELAEADLLWVPGGNPTALSCLMYTDSGKAYLDYLKQIASKAQWVTSVCEGALLLARAGLLNGFKATTHWAFTNCLRDNFPEITVIEEGHPRYVIDGNRITGAGISSGLDEALAIIELLAGTDVAMRVQQVTQYFPRPPVNSSIPPPGPCPVVNVPQWPCPWREPRPR